MSQQKTYDGPPSTFVNVKRVKEGQDSKGRDTLTVTFGLTTDQSGAEINTLDALIDALTTLQGKQANITIHLEDKQSSDGRTFKSAFARVTEMIPRGAPGGMPSKAQYVPKAASASRTEAVKAQAAKIRNDFQG